MQKIYYLFLLLLSACAFGQTISSGKWNDLFSYNNVLAMKNDGSKIMVATENGIFYYDTSSGEISKLSKANGLHEVKISAFDYNLDTKCALVGYVSGAMDLITPKGIFYIVDIPISTNYTGSKKINHISITGNQAAIATGYGVSIYNMDTQGFGDTAFFTSGGAFNACNAAVISGSAVFAATASGLLSHRLDTADTTLPIYSSWGSVISGNFVSAAANNTKVAAATATSLYLGNGTTFSQVANFSSVKDVTLSGENIAVTESQNVSLLNSSGGSVRNFSAQENLNTAIAFNGKILAGTAASGIIDEAKKTYKPDGPFNNISYKLSVSGGKILVSTGIREVRYNDPPAITNNLGFYYYTGSEWVYPHYFRDNQLTSAPVQFNVLDVVPNPSKTDEVYFTNYTVSAGQGVYRMKYDTGKKDFDLDKAYLFNGGSYWRPVGLTYDDKGNLFGSLAYYNGTVTAAFMAYDPAADKFIFLDAHLTNGTGGAGAQKPIIKDGFIWLPIPRAPYLSADEYKGTLTFSDDDLYLLAKKNGFSGTTSGILCMAMDNFGDAWIGTDAGLRILSNAASSIKDQDAAAKPVVITQNGLGEELFRDTPIWQIAVDSGNHKWVSTGGGGVYYLSPDGTQTFEHFTKANSPLPTDEVTDVQIDEKSGKVYFATYDGIVVYQGDVSNISENFANVLVYPNPVVYSNYKGNVKIKGLAETTNIRITDAAGNLVHQAVARGGFYEWDLNNMRGNRVASGIYFVLMTNADGTDKATAKIAVVN